MMRKTVFIHSLVIAVLCIFCANISYVYAQSTKEQKAVDSNADQGNVTSFYEALIDQRKETDAEIKELRGIIANQNQMIHNLNSRVISLSEKPLTNGTTFEVWSGIVLASLAVMITIFGIGIAVLAFFGYKNILKSASDAGSIQAKNNFKEFIKSDEMKKDILDVLDQISFRGIDSEGEVHQTEDNEDE